MIWRRKRDRELQQEIEAHFNLAKQDRIDRGEAPGDAEAAVRREFGNIPLVQEATRDVWGYNPFDGLAKDLRYALRSLRKSPAFTIIAVASLALGIGANTAVFSIVHHVLLKPLPYPESDRVVILNEISPSGSPMSVSYPSYKDWRELTKSYSVFAGILRSPATLTGVASPAQLIGRRASSNIFEIFGAKPILGRVFTAEEDRPGGPPVVVLSHAAWRQHFGGDPTIVGRNINLDATSYSVIGVLGPELKFYGASDEFYIPLAAVEAQPMHMDRGNHSGISVFARLKPGVEPSTTEAEIKGIAANLARQYPKSNSGSPANCGPSARP